MIRFRLEVLSGLNDGLGRKGAGPTVFEKEAEDGITVDGVIRKLAAEHQAFGEAILDLESNKISEQVAVVLNNRLLEAFEGLNTRMKDGDVLMFLPVIAGG